MILKKLEHALRSWTPRWRPTRFKATLVGMVVAAFAIPLAILAIPYLEIFNDMAVQAKGKSQGEYGWFSGQALVVERPPVEGTIPMEGYAPYRIDDPDHEVAARRAGETLVNPVPRTLEAMQRGKKLYNVYCIVCHGEHGQGDGPIVGPGLFTQPPTLHQEATRAFPDGRIFHVITRGQGDMPTYADKLDPEERWCVVHYVRVLQTMMASGGEEDDR